MWWYRRVGGTSRTAASSLTDQAGSWRVTMTSMDRVTLVAAELGTWAGSIGAAVFGAESAGFA